jgi:O-acetyl-ADP-ribose deacetylase (regulator of RNase III)
MITFKTGNLLAEPAEALVNTVNCVGVMGRGVALQFKTIYPQNFKAYAAACKREEVQPGKMFIFQISQLTNPKYIINFPTKRHWKGKSRIEDITSGLQDLVEEVKTRSIQSIALPPLGCGLGGLDWQQVKPMIEAAFAALPNVQVMIFEPNAAHDTATQNISSDVPNMTEGRAALVALMKRYLDGLLDPFISLLEVQKLMYFLQEAGQPLKLQYTKHHYGPYAHNLGKVLQKIEGHFTAGYANGGDDPTKQLTLVPKAAEDAFAFLSSQPDVTERFDRVAALVDGFETPFGLELLATVHWVVSCDGASSPEQAQQKVYGWNKRKKQFSERQIHLAYQTLLDKGWIAPQS